MRVLGLDGGGTKTEVAWVLPSGSVERLVVGRGLDPMAGDGWEARLRALVAGEAVERAVLGLPYFSEVEGISERQQRVAEVALGPGALVRNDVDVAFEGAMGGLDGVLILAGTGSMAWARGGRGTARAGGFGDAFGDEGSGYWIGREALALVSRHLDGRRRCAGFAGGVLGALGIEGAGLIGWTYGAGRAGVAGVARVVAELAEGGDRVALALLRRAGRELAVQGRAAGRRAGVGKMRWSYAGGVLGNPLVRGAVAEALGVGPVEPVLPPVGGAVLAAARAAGWDVGAGFQGRLAEELRTVAREEVMA